MYDWYRCSETSLILTARVANWDVNRILNLNCFVGYIVSVVAWLYFNKYDDSRLSRTIDDLPCQYLHTFAYGDPLSIMQLPITDSSHWLASVSQVHTSCDRYASISCNDGLILNGYIYWELPAHKLVLNVFPFSIYLLITSQGLPKVEYTKSIGSWWLLIKLLTRKALNAWHIITISIHQGLTYYQEPSGIRSHLGMLVHSPCPCMLPNTMAYIPLFLFQQMYYCL